MRVSGICACRLTELTGLDALESGLQKQRLHYRCHIANIALPERACLIKPMIEQILLIEV